MYDLGLTSEQVWELTPAQFQALSQRHDFRNRQADRRAATTSWTVANLFGRKENAPPVPIEHFMPAYGHEKLKQREMTGQQMKNLIMAIFPPEAIQAGNPEGA